MAQQRDASAAATGSGSDHHQAEIGILRGRVAEGELGKGDQVGVKQAEAQALRRVAAGRGVGEKLMDDQWRRVLVAFQTDVVAGGVEERLDRCAIGLRMQGADQHGWAIRRICRVTAPLGRGQVTSSPTRAPSRARVRGEVGAMRCRVASASSSPVIS